MTTFFFVRHGLTAHTGRKLSGWMPDIHLTGEGRTQAEAVADRLKDVPLKAVFASPIERTIETAEPIAARHKLKVEVRDGLGEVEYGNWTNRSLKVLARTKLWGVVQRWPSGARFPQGETLRAVQARAVDEIERIRLAHPKTAVCCVTHADVIRLVAAHYLGVHIDLYQRIVIGPASVTAISIGDMGPVVLSLNSPTGGYVL